MTTQNYEDYLNGVFSEINIDQITELLSFFDIRLTGHEIKPNNIGTKIRLKNKEKFEDMYLKFKEDIQIENSYQHYVDTYCNYKSDYHLFEVHTPALNRRNALLDLP